MEAAAKAILQAMEPFLPVDAVEIMREQPLVIIAFAVTVIIIVISVLLHLSSLKPKARSVLILGPSGSGKTTLFHRLQFGSTMNGFVASMQENAGEFVFHDEKEGSVRPLQMVDIPGNLRLGHLKEKYLPTAGLILFMVDSVEFVKGVADTAESLYSLLTHPAVVRRKLPLVVVCNKCDQKTKAFSPDFIRKQLEKEINRIRESVNVTVGRQKREDDVLSSSSSAFSFESFPCAISLLQVSAENGLHCDQLQAKIRQHIPA